MKFINNINIVICEVIYVDIIFVLIIEVYYLLIFLKIL